MFVEVPVGLFSFLFVTGVNGWESTVMLMADVFCSCSEARYLEAAMGWNTMVISITCVGLT